MGIDDYYITLTYYDDNDGIVSSETFLAIDLEDIQHYIDVSQYASIRLTGFEAAPSIISSDDDDDDDGADDDDVELTDSDFSDANNDELVDEGGYESGYMSDVVFEE